MTEIALVHDWLNQHGGAERVLEQLMVAFPGSPLYTSIYWADGLPAAYRAWDIRPSWLNLLPGIHRHHQWYFPLYAMMFANLNLGNQGYELVLSNKSGFSHGVRTGETPHLCYCLTPTRYVWDYEAYTARENIAPIIKSGLKPLVSLLRRWDYTVAQRPTLQFVAISTEVQQRIRTHYGRDAKIIHPPVDVSRYYPSRRHDDYYMIISRLAPYKRIDLAVQAFTRLGLPLLIAGDGRDRKALEAMAGPTITFLGRVPDEDLIGLLPRCRALIFPGCEDFGLTPVEAQAAGRPVIAYGAGGALDSVVEGITGTFFREPTVESLMEAVQTFDARSIDPAACRANAERFGVERFKRELLTTIDLLLAK